MSGGQVYSGEKVILIPSLRYYILWIQVAQTGTVSNKWVLLIDFQSGSLVESFLIDESSQL